MTGNAIQVARSPSDGRPQRLAHFAGVPRNANAADRARSEESWVEIDSQPSSSSFSSIGDEVVTTGLRVQDAARRRRRLRPAVPMTQQTRQARSTENMSSQEEYDESESESDRVMTSSNEGLIVRGHGQDIDQEAVASDDENRTAVNFPLRQTDQNIFTPQPNAFTHPPSTTAIQHTSESAPGSYFPQMPARQSRPVARHSFSAHPQHSPYNMISPSHNAAAHHDAALRASLSTLLSCAAAARGLPKSTPHTAARPSTRSNRIEPSTIRLVPATALLEPAAQSSSTREPTFLPTLQPSSAGSADQHKRKRTSSRDSRRKVRRSSSSPASSSGTMFNSSTTSSMSSIATPDDMLISPTLLTWVVSAGVVVLLSAISFTAGYSAGKEVGRAQSGLLGPSAPTGEGAAYAGEAGRIGLRRLRLPVHAM